MGYWHMDGGTMTNTQGTDNPVQIAPGGAVAGSLDLATEKDRGMVRNSIRRWPNRWRGLSPEFKDKVVRGLDTALDWAEAAQDGNALASIARVVVAMEGQVQADQHLEDKNTRIDTGQATEVQAVRVIVE